MRLLKEALRLFLMLMLVEAVWILLTGDYMSSGDPFGFGWEGVL